MNILIMSLNGQNFQFLGKKLAQFGIAVDYVDATTPVQDIGTSRSCDAMIVHSPRCDDNLAGIVAALRSHDLQQPLLTLSETSEWHQRVAILDAGSDDHLEFPVRSDELAARLRAVFRRSVGQSRGISRIGDFSLDLNARTVALDDRPLDLTRHEYRLLQAFLTRNEHFLSYQELLACLYTEDTGDRSANAVQVHICRLRSKIGSDRIQTARGLGYRINVSSESLCRQC